MFLENKYKRLYFAIVNDARENHRSGYVEEHHIIPVSIGGTDEPSNLVRLSAREHFICHRLLVNMTSGEHRSKMVHAPWLMSNMNSKITGRYVRLTSRSFDVMRQEHAKRMSARLTGIKRSEEHRAKLRKPKNEQARKNMSAARKGIKFSPTHCKNMGHAKSKKWVNNGTSSKMVSSCDLQHLLSQGWQEGRGQTYPRS